MSYTPPSTQLAPVRAGGVAPYARWAVRAHFALSATALVIGLTLMDVLPPVAGLLCLFAVLFGLGAVVAGAWPRAARWIVPSLLLTWAAFSAYGTLVTHTIWSAALPLTSAAAAALAVSLFGLLSTGHRYVAVACLAVPAALVLAGGTIAVKGREWHAARADDHSARMRAFAITLEGALAARDAEQPEQTERLNAQRVGSPPRGAREFAAAWYAARTDFGARAELLSKELSLRTAPCMSVQGPLAAWRQREPRTLGDLLGILSAGLQQCPLAGVDIDALEYILLLSIYWAPGQP